MPRRYFSSKAHALYFINAVAPTKMVDGSWLHGCTSHSDDSRFSSLIKIYLEELGDGHAEKNHVVLYRRLLASYGCNHWQDLTPEYFLQGAVQLALGAHAEQFLPEIVGFNLAYEQLPLHLLITAYELNELNIDPYYFTLHITVDNALSGHASSAVEAVKQAMPQLGDRRDFLRRMANGAKLNHVGLSTLAIIKQFNLGQEVIAVLQQKSALGQYMHADRCRIAGRTINQWLSNADNMPDFLHQLEQHGWINRHQDPQESRFWKLIEGDNAVMFGVFSPYEKQMLYDWIAGDCLDRLPRQSRLGMPRQKATAASLSGKHRLPDNIHVLDIASRAHIGQRPELLNGLAADVNSEQLLFERRICDMANKDERLSWLSGWLSPALHHTPVGLLATRLYRQQVYPSLG